WDLALEEIRERRGGIVSRLSFRKRNSSTAIPAYTQGSPVVVGRLVGLRVVSITGAGLERAEEFVFGNRVVILRMNGPEPRDIVRDVAHGRFIRVVAGIRQIRLGRGRHAQGADSSRIQAEAVGGERHRWEDVVAQGIGAGIDLLEATLHRPTIRGVFE